ncbi:diguanylate cyclase domain-containing protein [Silanimonas sp.]|jgi:diguanylate cyclase (GGDEF)-like protein|uniref:GGDEF domain-containing protein n=1 Tax=Silanimonas sp. TaxID=1929290 RepID=UPI0037CA6304
MPTLLARLLIRLRKDFRLSIITVFGVCAVVAIAPFAALRFAQGQWLAGVVDALIVLGIVGPSIYAWRGGNLDRAGLCIAITNTIGALLIVALLGKTGVFWLFPTLLANSFLIRPGIAGSLALGAVALTQLQPDAFESAGQRLTVTTTLLLVSLFAYIFAKRTAMQRSALEEIASLDPLTGARNRRAMEEEVAIALNAHQRTGRPVTLALLDLDHFKRVNDRHGHEAGDRLLCTFVELVRRSTRATDRLFRFGGEEFVLLMEHTDEIGAMRAFANLQRRIHEELHAGGDPVTASMGAAVLRHGEGRDAWFARADAALYRAKQNGRDRLVLDDAPP